MFLLLALIGCGGDCPDSSPDTPLDVIPADQPRESHLAPCAPGSALTVPLYEGRALKGIFWCYGDATELLECYKPSDGAASTVDDNGQQSLRVECPPEGDVSTWVRTDWGY